MTRKYSNVSTSMSLAGNINNSVTTLTVDDASGLPVTFPYAIAVDYEGATVEIVLVTAAGGNVLTVTRGQEDTAAQAHSTGAVVVHVATALDLQNAADHIDASQNVHGVGASASVVGTTTSQTLTNKTMSGASNTFSAIPGSAITGDITTGTITVANVTGDWPIDTRSTGSIPVDTRTTGNLPGSRLASPVTAAMTFSSNVVTNQPSTGIGLHAVNHATPNSEVMRVTAVSTQPGMTVRRNNSTATGSPLFATQTETGTSMVSIDRAGAMTSTSTIAATDFTITGSPDLSVLDELNALISPPRALVSRASNQTLAISTFTPIIFPTVVRELGGWTINTSTGEFSVPLDGFYMFSWTSEWDGAFVSGRIVDVLFRKNGSDQRLERADSDAFSNGAITVSYGIELVASDDCFWVAWQNMDASTFGLRGLWSGYRVGPVS